MLTKVNVTLDEKQQAELQMILADQDGPAALRFLKEDIWDQIQANLRKGLRSHLEMGGQ